MTKRGTVVIRESNDIVISAIKDDNSHEHGKTRLYLDVDGTLVAMKFDPLYMSNPEGPWQSVFRTDFCHWLNSIYSILDALCEVIVLTNFSKESELAAKEQWLKDNLKCKHSLILNKEGITKSLFVRGKQDILVDDTLRNLIEWDKVGGTQYAYQYVTCEKGRRELLETIFATAKLSK